jgi:cytoskeletal protein RodZ
MKRAKSKNLFRSTKSKVILLVVLVALLGVGAFALNKSGDNKNPTDNSPTASPTQHAPNGASPNLSPSTSQDQQYSDSRKDAIAQQQNSSGSAQGNDSGKSAVITDAGNNAVHALVSGVVENNGTCTFVFTQGANTVTKTSTGVANVSTTICALVSPDPTPSTFLSKGNWNVALSYTSSITSVKSSTYPFEVK